MLEQSRDEKGFVLAFCSLFMTVLLGIGGFSVDIGNWYLHALRLQRAADAAALAGSVYLPNDSSSARTAAEASLRTNGANLFDFEIEQSALHPTQLQVRVSERIDNYFTSLIGYDSITLTRAAAAEYRPYVPMGSPSNVLGTEFNTADSWEKASTKGKQNSYWLDIAGPREDKVNGDRYSSGQCSSGTANCNASLPIPNRNLDYSADGQIFVIRIPPSVVGTLSVQVFDAVFADVGNHCADNLNNASNYDGGTGLYARNDTPQCTGDAIMTSTSPAPDTTYAMYTPELSPSGSIPIATPGCTSKTYTGYKGAITSKVNPALSTYDPTFVAAFRKWSTICQMYVDGSTAGGDYLLKVKMGPNTATGHNRYAIRVGIINGGGSIDVAKTAEIQIFSKGRLVVYARESASSVNFYLARINSGAAGRTMTVTLFDIGDAAGTSSLQLLPPSDAKVNGSAMSSFSGCQYVHPSRTALEPTSGDCRVTGVTNSGYNGKLVRIEVDIPDGYSCDDMDINGCWTRLRVNYSQSVNDNTSWEVSLDGNPVHLVFN